MTTQEKLEHILGRLAVRMYDEGQLDKPSLLGRQVAVVNIREAQEAMSDLIESAKQEAYKQGYIDAGIKALTEQSKESE